MTVRKIKVLVVDDSPGFRAALSLALSSDPEIEVVGQAEDGRAAIAAVRKLEPDVVTMDAMMPVLDGLEAAQRILSTRPVPILLMTTLARSDEQRMALNALRLGVVDVTNKPVLAGPGGPSGIAQVIRLVKAAADVKVGSKPKQPAPTATRTQSDVSLIVIGCSTGGPPALERVLAGLPPRFPPVVVAQHLAPSFARGFAEWLGATLSRVVVPVHTRERLSEATIYVAGENRHLRVRSGVVDSSPSAASELSPRADLLFESAAHYGAGAVGVVLTGMGDDGAIGLSKMKRAGAWTIGQDAESCTVYGMPRQAREAGALCEVLTLDAIAARLAGLVAKETRIP
jgi:two-component system chemotaxis response regulator CheB